ncbi:MAG: LysR family transcriptional regulator [Gammaproteobacteria bacterium]|nr:LysR family transcriptional regulator [Gammaproteobacteria bacterium]
MKHLPSMKQLQYLIALADTKHFARAAKRCFVTQSTLSAGIRDLESVLGMAVAERTNRRVLSPERTNHLTNNSRGTLMPAQTLLMATRRSVFCSAAQIRYTSLSSSK